VYWLLGAAWFTILSKQWLAGMGKTMEQLQHEGGSPAVAYVVAFLSNVVIAYVLAWLVFRTGEQTATRGLKLGALLWIGLVATTMGTEFVFEGRSLEIFVITAGYPLVGTLLMGAIVGGWKKKQKA
jgi:uncharacterized membrane protein YdcZ (DUF606 family)